MTEIKYPYTVVVKEGKQFLEYNGEILPRQIESVVVQNVEHIREGVSICEVSIKVHAKLDDTYKK